MKALFKVFYGRHPRSLVVWFESLEVRPHGIDLLSKTLDGVWAIQDKLWVAQSRQKYYVEDRLCAFMFRVGDRLFLRESPMKDVTRFGRTGKLIPKYTRPFEILQIVGKVAYELAFPQAF